MATKQMVALFVCMLIPWTIGNGLVPLLPLYAISKGADPAVAGYYLAFSYLALTIGALSAGWISEKLHNRRLPLIATGILTIPISWLLGRVTNIWSMSVVTALLWFCGGLGIALTGILAALSASPDKRGKVFGILSISGGLGALFGGLSIGYLVDRWGFPNMFSAMSVFLILWPIAIFFLSDKNVICDQPEGERITVKVGIPSKFYLLFSASLVASIAGFIIVLVRSIIMSNLNFSSLAISSTGAIGGFVAMPLPVILSWLSDKKERKYSLYIGYSAGLLSLIILAFSTNLWHFWLVLIGQTILTASNGAIGNALVTDIVPADSLGSGLARFNASSWLGGMLGFAGAGIALKFIGLIPTLIMGGSLVLIAMIFLLPLRSR